MIKLSDFARVQGVTPRAVQISLKKYEKELEGHFERQGQNGTWLDDHAQEFLRSKMLKNPVVVYDEKTLPFYEDMRAAQKENEALKGRLADALERLANAQDQQLQLQAQLAEQKLLAAKATEAEQKVEKLEIALENERAVSEICAQNEVEAKRRAEEAEKAFKEAEKEKKTLADIAEMNAQEAEKEKEAKEEARAEAARANAEAEDLRRELDAIKAYEALPWWKKLTTKKPYSEGEK